MISWIPLTVPGQLDQLREQSFSRPQIIFKHSTRCSLSATVLARLERSTPPGGADFYFLDLLAYRSLSDDIAERFSVWHESPQILIVKNGDCVYDESHMAIRMDDIAEQVVAA